MKRIFTALAMTAMILMSAVYVNADIGMIEKPDYEVYIKDKGAYYYDTEDLYNSQSPSGTLPGGEKFYVWVDWGNGELWGTTDPSLSFDQNDQFVYIRSIDTVNEAEDIPEEYGRDQGVETEAVTTDELHVRCGPAKEYESKGLLKKGTTVTYRYVYTRETSDSDNAEWAYVTADGKTGWVSVKYLETSEVREIASENKEESEQEEVVPEPDSEGSVVIQTEDNGGALTDRKYVVAGIICVCIGAAILAAVIAYFLLNKRKRA